MNHVAYVATCHQVFDQNGVYDNQFSDDQIGYNYDDSFGQSDYG